MIHRKRLTYSLLAGLLAASLVLVTLFVLARTTPTLAAPTKNIVENTNTDFPSAPLPTVITVTTTTDENGTCDAPPTGECSLREAIIQANNSAGGDVIKFDILGCPSDNCTITPSSSLPYLTDGYISIDGYTQYGAHPASTSYGAAIIKISINGNGLVNQNGFNITSAHNTIRGLSIYNFKWAGISIWGATATNNVIAGNHIGVDASGEIANPNTLGGVIIGSHASNNTIGGNEYEDRNVISGNKAYGITIITSTLNTVSSNYIGVNGNGGMTLGNGLSGIYIGYISSQNTIGGNTSTQRNIISGNDLNGIEMWGSGTVSNTIIGNYIGLDREGLHNLQNLNHGVYVYGGAQNNSIGGSTAGERNVISGHTDKITSSGVYLYGATTSGNTISGNYIGTYHTGSGKIPNNFGVAIVSGANHNTVGGDSSGEGNLISGNNYNGVSLSDNGTAHNIVSGNIIGTYEDAHSSLSNGLAGVFLGNGAQQNTIGGDTAAEYNLISGNDYDGVYINGNNTMSNTVSGNYIGTGLNGTPNSFLGNGWYGVRMDGGAKYNRIGGATTAERNTIAGNDRDGVRIAGDQTMSNTILGNFIGFGSDGFTPGSNFWYGVTITDGAKYNLVGGDASSEGNVISGNEQGGVQVFGKQTAYNQVSGNIIGLRPDGTTSSFNAGHGVYLVQGTHHNVVGGERSGVCGGECNVIAMNLLDGVRIDGNGTMSNTVSGNLIGTDILGTTGKGNSGNGVTIRNGAQFNLIGGSQLSQRNIISGHTTDHGIKIEDTGSLSGTLGNLVQGNYVGLDVTGMNALPNSEGIRIEGSASDNQIGGNEAGSGNVISGNSNDGIRVSDGVQNNTIGPNNLISYNQGAGVLVYGVATKGIDISQNSIFANDSLGITLVFNANGNIQPPDINNVSSGSVVVTGSTCPECLVELFSNPDTDGEGKHYQGSNTADMSGYFTITVSNLLWPYLTATATDPISGTSQFSQVFEADNRQLFLPVVFR